MNKDKDLPLQEFKNFVNGPSNKNLFVLKENGKEYRAINDNNKSCLELQIDKGIIDNEEKTAWTAGTVIAEGKALITSFSINAGGGENATMSVTFTGVGALNTPQEQ